MIAQDLHYALRRIAIDPGFSALVVLTLALGIGANTAIFSVVDSILLRPLPYRDPDRLVTIEHRYPSIDLDAPVSAAGFRDYRDRTKTFESVVVQSGWGANLTGAGEPVRVAADRVSAGWFETYGIAPALGRTFGPEEDVRGKHRVVVISHAFWQRQLAGDPAVLGQTLSLNGETYEVVGVMPAGFRAFWSRGSELWVPLALSEEQFAEGATNEWLNSTARLEPGVTLEQAQAEMRAFAETMKRDRPDDYHENWTLQVTPLHERATGELRPAVLLLLGAVGFVLLIACANVANLLLARGAGRRKEVAIRMAMGASRSRLVRQMLVESTVLALAGAVLGAVIAWAGLAALTASFDTTELLRRAIRMDASVLVFTLALAVATGVGFGLVPALQVAGSAMQETLHEGGRAAISGRGSVLRRTFVIAEFGMALSLLAGAGLLIKSIARVYAVDPGFDARNLLTANVALPQISYPDEVAQRAFFDRAIERIAQAPGVRGVGVTSVLPFGGSWTTGSFAVEGYSPPSNQQVPWGDIRVVSPGFATAMRLPLLRGRFFEDRDDAEAPPVVVVDEQTVKRYLPNQDPIGMRISFDGTPDADSEWLTIVGVVGHAAHEGLDADPRVQVYLPYRQASASVHDVRDSHRNQARARPARRSLRARRGRSAAAARVGSDHGGAHRALGRPAATRGGVAVDLRRARPRARGHRDLRRGVLRRRAAHAGARGEDGPRRRAPRPRLDGALARRATRGLRRGTRCDRVACARAGDPEPALRCACYRRPDLRRGGGVARRCRSGRDVGPGAAGHATRSGAGVAAGVNEG